MTTFRTRAEAGTVGYIRIKDLVKRVPVAKSTIWLWVSGGKFPAPVKLSERVTAWPVAAVERWEFERHHRPPTDNQRLSADSRDHRSALQDDYPLK
jgi:predicted DNA-binding transcriptional regulator AlpA